ncbi:MAG: hypothetical protein R3F56_18215 [Planctomycetota bacterium]
MDRLLRHGTLLVLLVLAFVVWFESSLFGGDRGVMRLAVGLLCFYVAVQSIERQRLATTFKQVLQAFQTFRATGGGDTSAGVAPATKTPTAKERCEAAAILIAAMRRGGPTADLALGNLRRVTGVDHGPDPDAWQRWLDAQPPG